MGKPPVHENPNASTQDQLDAFNGCVSSLVKLSREQQMRNLAALIILFDARTEVNRRLGRDD